MMTIENLEQETLARVELLQDLTREQMDAVHELCALCVDLDRARVRDDLAVRAELNAELAWIADQLRRGVRVTPRRTCQR